MAILARGGRYRLDNHLGKSDAPILGGGQAMANNYIHLVGSDRLHEQLVLANLIAHEMSDLKALRKKVAIAERAARSRARAGFAEEAKSAVDWSEA